MQSLHKNYFFTVILWAMQQFAHEYFSIYLFDTNIWPNFIRDWDIRPLAPWDNEQERSNILLCYSKNAVFAKKLLLYCNFMGDAATCTREFSIYLFDINMWPNFIRDWHIRPLAPWANELERSNILLCYSKNAVCTGVFFNILVWYKYMSKFHERLTHQTSGVQRYWTRKLQHIAMLLKICSLCIKND